MNALTPDAVLAEIAAAGSGMVHRL